MPDQKPRPVILSEFGPPSLSCIRSWGKNGLPVGMICIRSEKQPAPASRYLVSHCSLPPKELFTPGGIRRINDFLKSFHASGIIAINEKISCWINDNRSCIDPSVSIWAPSNSVALALLSKITQLEIARRIGFDVLPTYLIGKKEDILASIPQTHYPLCLRPDGPGAVIPSFKVRMVHSEIELTKLIHDLEKINRPMLAQPFANLPNLVVHGARTISGDTIGLQAFLVERKFQGVTLTICPDSIDDELRHKCAQFVNHFNIEGNFHFEFLLDRNSRRMFFLEINCRLGGTTAKVCASGYEEPMLALAAYGIGQFHSPTLSNRIVSGKHALIKYCIYTLTNRLSALDYPNEPAYKRLIKSIYGLIAYKDEVLSFSDIRGSLAFYQSLLKGRS